MNRKKELKDIKVEIANKAYQDWLNLERQPQDQKTQNETIRFDSYLKRESLRRSNSFDSNDKILLERIIGPTNDIRDQPPFELARKRGRPVARIHEYMDGVLPEGFGTGFLMAPNLLITNHHVLPSKNHAVDCAANFLHERDTANRIQQGSTFRLRPEIFFYNFEFLDFAIVYVDSESTTNDQKLEQLGYLPMIATRGKVLKGKPLSIIQYPMGGYKKYVFENNVVTDIDDEKGIIQYTTDTQPAASGSPGFNDAWEVATLHYTGIPYQVDGKWMTKRGMVWDRQTMSEDEINWIANAGKSISKIVAHLKTLQLSPERQKYITAILENTTDPVLQTPEVREASTLLQTNLVSELKNPNMGTIILNFSGSNTIYINSETPKVLAPVEISSQKSVGEIEEIAIEKKARFDENYANRKGFDEGFIPGFQVLLPTVKQRKGELYKKWGGNEPYILKYHHYSLVMNKKRRLCMWSAANVDYSESARDERSREDFGDTSKAWRLDARIPAKYQIQDLEFYAPATLIDRGHIVRRDDNCWWENKDSLMIEYANSDTFHWTNCAPQHEEFNQDMFGKKGKWGVLENAIKSQLNDPANEDKDYGQKANVLAGPILDDNDPEYNDIQFPLQFWKVFAINSASEGCLVYGFVLSQKQEIDEFGLEEALPRFGNTVRALQVSLKQIEELSGVTFDETLHQYDVKQGTTTEFDPRESLKEDLSNFVKTKHEKEKSY